jgi:hypothetical protein
MNTYSTPPEPRSGLAGERDKLVGAGQTPAEFWLIVISARLAGLEWFQPVFFLKLLVSHLTKEMPFLVN